MNKKPVRSTKPAPAVLRPALSPFDVEMTPEAQKFIEGTISEIVTNFLAKGIRTVAVPIGQANAVKTAFEEAPCATHEAASRAGSGARAARRWTVEIAKINGILAELHFHTDDDPRVTPPASAILPAVDALLEWARSPEADALRSGESPWANVFGDDNPLGRALGNLRVVRALVDG